jgi:predicted DNA-binding protein YlxM (UPF0122 family)
MDQTTLAALGIVEKTANKLDLSACLKDRYHHRMTFQAIADKYGVSRSAVFQRLEDFTNKLGDPDELRSFQDMEADIQSAIKRRFSSELLNVDLSKTSPRDLAVTYGVIYDKHRLQTGQSTNNQSVFFQIVADSDQSNSEDQAIIEGETVEP